MCRAERARRWIDCRSSPQNLVAGSGGIVRPHLLRQNRLLHLPLAAGLGPLIGFDKLPRLREGPFQLHQQ